MTNFGSRAAGVFVASMMLMPMSAQAQNYGAQQRPYEPQVVAMPTAPQSNLTLRVNQLERELQLLTGRLEKVSHDLGQANKRIDTLTAALNQTGPTSTVSPGTQPLYPPMTTPSGPLSPEMGSAPAEATGGPRDLVNGGAVIEAPSPGSETMSLPDDPGAAYDLATDALLDGDYATAEAAFTQFLVKFPNDPKAADAQFRLGEIFLATGAYSKAASAFLKHVKTYPDNVKAAEGYLKLGISFARLEKNKEACQVFAAMKKKFPNAAADLVARRTQESTKAGC